ALRERGEAIVQQVLSENESRWVALSDEDRSRVEVLARAVVNRLLHEPTLRLKESAHAESYVHLQALRELFGLEPSGSGWLEQPLLRGEVDLAVHSAKDVPTELPDGLAMVGVPARADARDAVCGAGSRGELAEGVTVGTASLRRRAQLLARRPDLRVEDLRG